MALNSASYKHSKGDWHIDDPGASGALPNNKSGVVAIETAASESRTLAAPEKAGIDLTLAMKTDGGTCTITTATAYTEGGDTTISLSDPGQYVRLMSIASGTAFVWRVVGRDPDESSTFNAITASTVTSGQYLASGGSSVTQASSITTAVEVDDTVGFITTVSSTLGAAASARAEFTLTNAAITANDVVLVTAKTAGAGTPVAYASNVATGSCTIVLDNKHASAALDNTVVINFVVVQCS